MQKKRILILITCLVLSVTAILGASAAAAAPPGQNGDVTFSTPEDAITHYFEGVTEGDFSKILQACAIDEMSENFRFDLQMDWLKMSLLSKQDYGPADYSLYVELNKAAATSIIARQVRIFTYSLLGGEDLDYEGYNEMDLEAALSFMSAIDPSRLASLEVLEIDLPNHEIMTHTAYREDAARTARIYGADEQTERVVLFAFEGNLYMSGFTLLRYGESWKISFVSSRISGLSPSGIPTKFTDESSRQ